MSQFTRFVAAAAATGVAIASAVTLAVGTGPAVADETSAAGSKFVPLASFLRRCDHSNMQYVPSDTKGTGWTIISRSGSTVTAEVHMVGVIPDIWYGVRLIEVPRPGISCSASDPGVGMGQLFTDWAGNGTATISAPVMSGATGAWVSVEGPLGVSTQLTGDFRTSDYVAAI